MLQIFKWPSNRRNWTTCMMVVEKKTASTMDPTHPPKNQPNFNKILPFFNLFSNSRTLTYYTWVDLMWISLVKQYIQNFLYWKKNCISGWPHPPTTFYHHHGVQNLRFEGHLRFYMSIEYWTILHEYSVVHFFATKYSCLLILVDLCDIIFKSLYPKISIK